MAIDIEKYKTQVKNWIAPYLKVEAKQQTTLRCCLKFTKNEALLICIDKKPDLIEILFADSFRFESKNDFQLTLTGMVAKNELKDIPAYWLLEPGDYQIFLIESLPVPEKEFYSALCWRIRSLISYPIDEAVVDYFMLPSKKNTPDHPMIAAIVAQKSHLQEFADRIEEAGLNLTIIDIPELALKPLAMIHEHDEKGTAFLYFSESCLILNISIQKTLYFTRQIQFASEHGSDKIPFEKISLEIIRYFDFFQSQWRLPAPSRIFVASELGNANLIVQGLTEKLNVKVEPYSLDPFIVDIRQRQIGMKYLLNLGCAIREDKEHASAAS